ncbi:hypothetical protein Tco_0657431 [Tanacetum coccineum]|uniref:Uncharacterized protein n=1 Tax=Tanacetum coccineum TaxID=301880 RepID=A0ABQ4XC58_9ASTR
MPTKTCRSLDGLHFDDKFSLSRNYRDTDREVKSLKRCRNPHCQGSMEPQDDGPEFNWGNRGKINSGSNTHIFSQRPASSSVCVLRPVVLRLS